MQKNIADFVNLGKYQKSNSSITIKPNIVFIGDSITEDWNVLTPDFFIENNFINRGISGQITSQILLRFYEDVVKLQPVKTIILCGINDIAENHGKMPLEMSLSNIKMMCDVALQNNIKPIIATLTPVNSFFWKKEIEPKELIITFNHHLKELAILNNIEFLDFYEILKNNENRLDEKLTTDGGHLSKLAYQKLNQFVLSKII